MAYLNKRQLYQQPAFDTSADTKTRVVGRDPLRRLKTIKELDPAESSVELSKSKLVSTELSGASPYATSIRYPLFRSKSVTKFKSKAGRGSSPEKDKSSKTGSFHTRTASLSLAKGAFQATIRLARSLKKSTALSRSFCGKDGFKPEDNMSLSFMTMTADSSRGNKESPLINDLKAISDRMERGLREVEERGDWKAEMKICSKAFGEVIGLGATFGTVLDRIKGKYEHCIGQLTDKHGKEVGKLKEEIAQLHQSISKEIEEKKAIKRKFEKISRESVELSRSCDAYQNKCFEYQEKLYEIANVSLEGFPPSETAWRLLLSELETYKIWKESAEKELHAAQQKERKLLELLHAIKKHGFPVEDVYNTEVKKYSKVASSSRAESEENSDAEQLVVGPPLARKRPEQVPALKIETIEVEQTSMSESFSLSSTLNDWKNTSIGPGQYSKRDSQTSTGQLQEVTKAGSTLSLQGKKVQCSSQPKAKPGPHT